MFVYMYVCMYARMYVCTSMSMYGGHKGSVKKAYVHRASKGSNPLGTLYLCMYGKGKGKVHPRR